MPRRIYIACYHISNAIAPYRYLDETRAKENTFTEEYLKVARQAVASSVVLLKNEAEVLPIKKDSDKTIAVIGPMMNNTSDINGSWTCLGDGKQSVSFTDRAY